MIFDCLIIGGGVSGMQCALVLGSAKNKPFAADKNIGIVLHQRASHLENALFNNVLGLSPKTLGKSILSEGKQQLADLYPEIHQIEKEKVISVIQKENCILIETNKNSYKTKTVVVAVGPSNLFNIDGLMQYVEPHQKLPPQKERIQLKNYDHFVTDNIYVAGVLAGHRSQFAIACGSGASVATDILTSWNNGNHSMVHDKIE